MISVNVDITLMARFIFAKQSFEILKCVFIYINCSFVQNTYYVLLKKIVSVRKTVLQQKCILRVYLAQKTHYGMKVEKKNPIDVGIGIGIYNPNTMEKMVQKKPIFG